MYTRSLLPRLPALPDPSRPAAPPFAPSGHAAAAASASGVASPPGRACFSPLAALPFLSFFLCFFRFRSGSGLPQ